MQCRVGASKAELVLLYLSVTPFSSPTYPNDKLPHATEQRETAGLPESWRSVLSTNQPLVTQYNEISFYPYPLARAHHPPTTFRLPPRRHNSYRSLHEEYREQLPSSTSAHNCGLQISISHDTLLIEVSQRRLAVHTYSYISEPTFR